MRVYRRSAILLCCLGLLAACSKEEPTTVQHVPDKGRPETRSLEAADAVGYNGKEIRGKVDAALNANDASIQKMHESIEQQGGGEAAPAAAQ